MPWPSVFCKIPLLKSDKLFPFIVFTDFPCQIVIFHQEMARFKGVVPGREVGDSHMKGVGMLIPRGGGVLGFSFAWYVPMASQSPWPIIDYFVASYRPHLSHFLGKCNFRDPN